VAILYLREAQVNGDSLGDVEESAVGAQGKGESVQTLENVRALMLVEQFQRVVVVCG